MYSKLNRVKVIMVLGLLVPFLFLLPWNCKAGWWPFNQDKETKSGAQESIKKPALSTKPTRTVYRTTEGNNVIKVGETVFPLTLDPFNVSRPVEKRISSLIFQNLIEMGKNNLVEVLISDVEEGQDERGKQMENILGFKLQDKAFSDNSPINFEDLEYSIQMLQKSNHPFKIFFRDPVKDILQTLPIENYYQIRLSENFNLDYNKSRLQIPMVKRGSLGSSLTRYWTTDHAGSLVGSGPFVLSEFDNTNDRYVLTKNTGAAQFAKMPIEKMEFYILQEQGRLLDALKNFERHGNYLDIIPFVSLSNLNDLENYNHLTFFDSFNNSFYCLGFNYQANSDTDNRLLFSRKKFREILAQGFNRKRFFHLEYGEEVGQIIDGPLPDDMTYEGIVNYMPDHNDDKESVKSELRRFILADPLLQNIFGFEDHWLINKRSRYRTYTRSLYVVHLPWHRDTSHWTHSMTTR